MTRLKNLKDVKPVLKWAGGKRQLVPYIREFYKNLTPNKYIEPFFGGGAVYFDVLNTFGHEKKNNAIINDINKDLINMYRDIKSKPDELIYFCKTIESDYKKTDYYFIRNRFNGQDAKKNKTIRYENIERSAALIFLNRTCFNGLYRVNKNGFFNVPKGSYKNPLIIDEDNLYKLSFLLPDLKNIRCQQFDEIEEIKKGDLVYFDPPYHPLNETSSFTAYSGAFGRAEQIRLRNYFQKLNQKGVHVILSNSSAPFIREIYSANRINEVFCGRNINSKSNKRGKIPEYLVLGDTI